MQFGISYRQNEQRDKNHLTIACTVNAHHRTLSQLSNDLRFADCLYAFFKSFSGTRQ